MNYKMNPVFDAIEENLYEIEIMFGPTPDSFKSDRKQTGDAREISVTEFLQRFFPPTYAVRKGLIHSKHLSSKEIDCVILAENHPPLGSIKRTIIIAEGVFAAVEVKPDISTLTKSSEFYRALEQVKSVKDLKRKWKGFADSRSFPEGHQQNHNYSSIPTFIFAKKSRPLKDTLLFMEKCVKDGDFKPSELPDGVVSLNQGILFHSATIWHSALQTLVEDSKQAGKHPPFSEGYIFFTDIDKTLVNFIYILCHVNPPHTIIDRPIIESYFTGMPIQFKVIPIYRT